MNNEITDGGILRAALRSLIENYTEERMTAPQLLKPVMSDIIERAKVMNLALTDKVIEQAIEKMGPNG